MKGTVHVLKLLGLVFVLCPDSSWASCGLRYLVWSSCLESCCPRSALIRSTVKGDDSHHCGLRIDDVVGIGEEGECVHGHDSVLLCGEQGENLVQVSGWMG